MTVTAGFCSAPSLVTSMVATARRSSAACRSTRRSHGDGLRAERINIRLGTGDYHSASAEHSRAYPRWPPPDLPPLVERRPPGEAWKDRVASDEPTAWRAAVWLTPPWTSEDAAATRASWELTVSEVASAAGADRWGGDEMAGFLEDLAQASRETAGASISWASYHRPSYRIWFCERAASAALASEQARRRCRAPENWDVEPGGAEPDPR